MNNNFETDLKKAIENSLIEYSQNLSLEKKNNDDHNIRHCGLSIRGLGNFETKFNLNKSNFKNIKDIENELKKRYYEEIVSTKDYEKHKEYKWLFKVKKIKLDTCNSGGFNFEDIINNINSDDNGKYWFCYHGDDNCHNCIYENKFYNEDEYINFNNNSLPKGNLYKNDKINELKETVNILKYKTIEDENEIYSLKKEVSQLKYQLNELEKYIHEVLEKK